MYFWSWSVKPTIIRLFHGYLDLTIAIGDFNCALWVFFCLFGYLIFSFSLCYLLFVIGFCSFYYLICQVYHCSSFEMSRTSFQNLINFVSLKNI